MAALGQDIFIAGCARSGTTLLLDLMASFRDTFAFSQFQDRIPDPTDILRRALRVHRKTSRCRHHRQYRREAPIRWMENARCPAAAHSPDLLRATSLRGSHEHPPQDGRQAAVPRRCRNAGSPNTRRCSLCGPHNRSVRLSPFGLKIWLLRPTQQRFPLHAQRAFSSSTGSAAIRAGIVIDPTRIHAWSKDPHRYRHVSSLPVDLLSAIARFNAEFGYPDPAWSLHIAERAAG